MTQIIFVNKEKLLSERQELLNQAAKHMAKIVSLNCRYSGYILKIKRKLEKIEQKLGE
jgi:hypothetical protein